MVSPDLPHPCANVLTLHVTVYCYSQDKCVVSCKVAHLYRWILDPPGVWVGGTRVRCPPSTTTIEKKQTSFCGQVMRREPLEDVATCEKINGRGRGWQREIILDYIRRWPGGLSSRNWRQTTETKISGDPSIPTSFARAHDDDGWIRLHMSLL